MAHAEIFFTSSFSSEMRPYEAAACVAGAPVDTGFTLSPTCRNAPAVATTRAVGFTPSAMGAPFSTLLVGQHGRLRQHDALRVAHGDLGACKSTRTQVGIRCERDANHAQPRLR